MISRKPYNGRSRKLVLAFDVGTTFSGVSYSLLDPGEVPQIHGVSRYPAQEHVGGDNKIPSILYYDQAGAVRAVGAEALQEHIIEKAEEENWVKLEWWKLHLRAKHLASSHIKDGDIPPLPRGKSAVQVLADFMRYLFSCTRTYIIESHASGASLWQSVEKTIEFILTHPNGWEGAQQEQIRRAAEIAGLVPCGEKNRERIWMLTEGEASLHFCVNNILASESLSKVPIDYSDAVAEEVGEESDTQGIIIIDAGGGTIDLSAYSMSLVPPKTIVEIAPAECRLQGSVFVTQRAHHFLRAKLANSRYGAPEIVHQMKDIFDRTTKLRFRDASDPQYIRFGMPRDKDIQYDIRSGQIKIPGQDVATFFEPSIQEIANAFQKQCATAKMGIKYAFLVGGYAASDFLYGRLQQHPVFLDVHLCRPASHVNKAVADGAVSFYLDHLVAMRISRFTYGVDCMIEYNPLLPDHRKRQARKCISPAGRPMLREAFESILLKGIQVSEEQEFRESFTIRGQSRSEFNSMEMSIFAYRGNIANPHWLDEDPANFTRLCNVVANTSKITRALRPERARGGGVFYSATIDVILLFGLTELKAQISWIEKGREKRGPASIVYFD